MDDHALPVLDRKRIEEELKFKLKNNVGEVVLTLLIVVLLFFCILRIKKKQIQPHKLLPDGIPQKRKLHSKRIGQACICRCRTGRMLLRYTA